MTDVLELPLLHAVSITSGRRARGVGIFAAVDVEAVRSKPEKESSSGCRWLTRALKPSRVMTRTSTAVFATTFAVRGESVGKAFSPKTSPFC
jgi:hypothetical protein